MAGNNTYTGLLFQKEFICDCGIRCRVDASVEVACAPDSYQHRCGKLHPLAGPYIAAYEERNGAWVPV